MTTRTPSSGWLSRLAQGSLVKQILIGLVLGVLLALVSKPAAIAVGLLGTPVRRRVKSGSAGAGIDACHGLDRQPSARTKNQYTPHSVSLSAGHTLARR